VHLALANALDVTPTATRTGELSRAASDRHQRLLVVGIVLVAWALRLAAFASVPGGIQHDEVTEALHADEVIAGRLQLYFYLGDFKGREPMLAYLQAGALQLLGHNLWGLRFISVASGLLTVVLTYVVGRRMFSRTAGLVAAMVVAVAFWPLVMSRVALRAVLIPPLAALSIYLLWRLYLGKEGVGFSFCAGFTAALCSYAYLSGWALLAAIVAFLLYAVLWDRRRLRSRRQALTAYFVGIGVTLLPLLATMMGRQEATARVSQLAPLLQDFRAGNPLPLLNNLLSVFGSFSIRGDQFGLYNIPNQPILPLGLGILFTMGVLLTLWRFRMPAYALLLVWLAAGLLPAALAIGGPNHLRSVASLPATYLMIGVAAAALLEASRQIPGATWIAALGLVGVICWTAQGQLADFLERWPRNADTRYFFRTALAEAVRQLPEERRSCVSTPYLHDLSQWVAEYTQSAPSRDICWFQGARALAIPAGDGPASWFVPIAISPDGYLAAEENAEFSPALYRLLEGSVVQGGASFEDGVPAFHRYDAGERATLRKRILDSVQATGLGWSEKGVEGVRLLSGAARLDGGLTLLGVQYLPFDVNSRALEVLLYWQVDADQTRPAPFSVFAQLLDANNQLVAGNDHLDYAVNSWRTGDIFVQQHRLELPAGAPPGVYYPQTGVYNWQTNARWSLLVENKPVDSRVLLPPVRFD
jgi:4-amino-4-deoxy-L-arabinose transferase-like glycosyltransferase